MNIYMVAKEFAFVCVCVNSKNHTVCITDIKSLVLLVGLIILREIGRERRRS